MTVTGSLQMDVQSGARAGWEMLDAQIGAVAPTSGLISRKGAATMPAVTQVTKI